MTPRRLIALAAIGFVALLCLAATTLALVGSTVAPTTAAPAKPGDPTPAVALPVSRVVLFNSGIGYFARSGEVEGEARVDLTFSETDVNDLLKSMTVEDLNGGRVAAVSYDSREPASRTLASFALNLNDHPTLADLLTQARGEKVEVALQGQPGTLTGSIVGLEAQPLPVGPNQLPADINLLNLLTADGLRAIKMTDVVRIKFLNPALEAELKRALEVLAQTHDSRKKAVSLHLTGAGKRRIRVGYVTEAPVWKTAYRLVLDKDGKPVLQAWAIVENQTDEDWRDVKLVLVSGRPLAFQMNLYDPLYATRPVVEPEQFAGLRPPTYQGGVISHDAIAAPKAPAGGGGFPGGGGFGGGGFPGIPNRGTGPVGRPLGGSQAEKAKEEEERRKEYAGEVGRELQQRMDLGAAQSKAVAGKLGDYFQYVVDHPVTLNRQKSALLPILTKELDGTRVSIFNPAVQPMHPLLGLKFKNTTGAQLAHGPVTVFEGSTYAGDARLSDVQPNESRLIAYAIDLGTEVVVRKGPGSTQIHSVIANRGVLKKTHRIREEHVYRITNRSDAVRTVLVEHPNRTNQHFKLVEAPKGIEETADWWRFPVEVAAGKGSELKVIEEHELGEEVTLMNLTGEHYSYYLGLTQVSPALKEKLKVAMVLRGGWDMVRQELAAVIADVQRITADQDRIRKNLRETPKEATVYDVYLKKLSDQEKELDALTAKHKQVWKAEAEARRALETFLAGVSD